MGRRRTGSRHGTTSVRGALSPWVKLTEFLQGKWLGHPLHPAIVHVPIGAWFAACVFDLLARNDVAVAALIPLSKYCVALGLLTVLAAVPTGLADWAPIKKERPAWKLGLVHLIFNLLAALVWAANFGLRLSAGEKISTAVLATSLTGIVLVFIGGYIGELLVFDQGTSVARLSKRKWRAMAERGGSRIPSAK